jgi:poly-gamma-glutamate capsule biosynthesis protein CapA/YwtB (metallophosphatase superfamily)
VTTLFLCGDVMIGRGIDQVLEHSVAPGLHEQHVTDARDYVRLAETASGPIPRSVESAYVWGAAVPEIERRAPDVRIINLETAVTTSADAWRRKEVLYRTHPGNVAVLSAARIDCCVLANNHVLDWGYPGLAETLDAVRAAGIATVGAGRDLAEARAPAIFEIDGGRVIVVGIGSTSAGLPAAWGAAADRAGVNLAAGWSLAPARAVAELVEPLRRPGDVVVVSIHWGTNWGYDIPDGQRRLARAFIDAGVDVVHGHSSHHPRGIEVYRERLILYGCGDLITDYEGIGGHEAYRDDLVLAYFPTLEAATGRLLDLTMAPFRLRRFRLELVGTDERAWLVSALDRTSGALGVRIVARTDGTFGLG